MGGMFRALLICSDEDCAELFEAYGTLEELEALACDCGCSLHVLTLSETKGEEDRGFDLARVA
jgi:dihydroorotase